jgi:5'-3' exoribonuclease 1
MHYYYSGVASWGWFYDYHYAPRISGELLFNPSRYTPDSITDLKDIDKMTFNFKPGIPFKPFQQLMGVLPEASKKHIPEAYQVRSPNL